MHSIKLKLGTCFIDQLPHKGFGRMGGHFTVVFLRDPRDPIVVQQGPVSLLDHLQGSVDHVIWEKSSEDLYKKVCKYFFFQKIFFV